MAGCIGGLLAVCVARNAASSIAGCALVGLTGGMLPGIVGGMLADLHRGARDQVFTECGAVNYACAITANLATGVAANFAFGWRGALLFGAPAASCWPPFSSVASFRSRLTPSRGRASAFRRQAQRFWSCSGSAWRWR